MTDISAFVAYAQQQLTPILDSSGEILYSGASTLRAGKIYLMGLNPGGDPAMHPRTIRYHLEKLPSKVENHYLDQSWAGRTPGSSPLQKRVQWLAKELGLQLREVLSSNLIFVRSMDALRSGYPQLAHLCWPVHQAILDIVQPRLVVTFGNSGISPYAYLQAKLNQATEECFPSGHGKWQCSAFAWKGIRVVGLPHLSRYAVNRHPAVAEKLRGFLAA